MTEAELRQSAILSKTEVETFSISQSFQERSPNTTESEKQILMLCKLQVFNMKKSKVFVFQNRASHNKNQHDYPFESPLSKCSIIQCIVMPPKYV